jgi:hypothetical protein
VPVDQLKKILLAWGPGRYDAELNHDGKGFRPDGKTGAVLLSAAFGLAAVNSHTYTGSWGTVTYWNAYVANTQMRGEGHVHRSAAAGLAVPSRGEAGGRGDSPQSRPRHQQAGGVALLPVGTPGAPAAKGVVRSGGREER